MICENCGVDVYVENGMTVIDANDNTTKDYCKTCYNKKFVWKVTEEQYRELKSVLEK